MNIDKLDGYHNVFVVAEDADFSKMGHCGHMVDAVLVPAGRAKEFFDSSGFLCLFPMVAPHGKFVLYSEMSIQDCATVRNSQPKEPLKEQSCVTKKP